MADWRRPHSGDSDVAGFRAGAAALVVILLAACGEAGTPLPATPSPTSSPADSAAATVSPTELVSPRPTASPALPGDSWELITGWPQGVNAVTAGGPGWVAVGTVDDGETFAAWSSTDGRVWSQSAQSLELRLHAVVGYQVDPAFKGLLGWDGSSFYAAAEGYRPIGGGGGLHRYYNVLRSEDGSEWEVVGSGDLFDLGRPRLYAMAAGTSGIVLLGTVHSDRDGSVPYWWFSRDGSEWQRAPQLGFSSRDATDVHAYSVAAGGPGFVVTGYVCDPAGCRWTTWASADGRAWSEGGDLPPGAYAYQVLASADGYLLLVAYEDEEDVCRQRVWSSRDRITWSATTIDGCGLRLAESGGRLLLVGYAPDDVIVWTSNDNGLTFDRRPVVGMVGSDRCGVADLAGGPRGAILMSGEGHDAADWDQCSRAWITPGVE